MTATLTCTDAIHRAIKADDAAWARQPFVGLWRVDEDGEVLISDEVRNCAACHTTMMRPVKP